MLTAQYRKLLPPNPLVLITGILATLKENLSVDLSNIYLLQAAGCNKIYYYDRSYP